MSTDFEKLVELPTKKNFAERRTRSSNQRRTTTPGRKEKKRSAKAGKERGTVPFANRPRPFLLSTKRGDFSR